MNTSNPQIKLSDPLLFLIGDKAAITRLAGSWFTLLIGALLVVTAGIARNYDHHYFLAEWQWLYGPFVASFSTSIIIFIVGLPFATFKKSFFKNYLCFLSLYWMTSPCAWLYALPIESFASILTATKWNIAFLAIVSLWRVFLIARCIQVLSNENYFSSLIRIILPASIVMCFASLLKGMDIIGIMGGVKLSPTESILATAAEFTTVTTFWTSIFSIIASLFLTQYRFRFIQAPLPWRQTVFNSKLLVYSALLIPLALLCTVPIQQKAKRNHTLKALLDDSRITGHARASIDYAAQFQRDDFLTSHHFPPAPKGYYIEDLVIALNPDDPQWIYDEWETLLSQKTDYNNRQEVIENLREENSDVFDQSPLIMPSE